MDKNNNPLEIVLYRRDGEIYSERSIKYIKPGEKINNCDLMVIDEAAAIPIHLVRPMLSSKRVFISSTIHGYEGTGRSLSLKLIEKIRKEQKSSLWETTMEIPIRYSIEDPIEEWL